MGSSLSWGCPSYTPDRPSTLKDKKDGTAELQANGAGPIPDMQGPGCGFGEDCNSGGGEPEGDTRFRARSRPLEARYVEQDHRRGNVVVTVSHERESVGERTVRV
jgi:hypothetical protein